MTARRLDGKTLAESRKAALRETVSRLAAVARPPRLAVLLATADDAAAAYAQAKAKAGRALGIDVDVMAYPRPTTAELVDAIALLGRDDAVDGILVETPVGAGVDLRVIQDAIPEEKDVDGASTRSLGRLFCGNPTFAPATAAAVMALLDGYAIGLSGRRAVVIGRSLVVGRPLAQLLLARDATVTVCHSRTRDLGAVTVEADIVCAAVGRPRFVGAAMVRPGAVVIDIGTNVVDGKLVGDVDLEAVANVAAAVSPVPGGVGPLTTVLALEHVVTATGRRFGLHEGNAS